MHKPIKAALIGLAFTLAFSTGMATAESSADTDATAKEEIIEVVEASYIHGAFNEQNTAAMREGFHPIFKIHGLREGELSTYPITDWVNNIEKGKAKADYQAETWEHRFPLIDVTGNAAIVKVELIRVDDGKKTHVYTDYLSLLRFEDGWKITGKVYHGH